MRTHIVRFGIALVLAALFAGPGLFTTRVAAEGQGPPPGSVGECVSNCMRGLSVLGQVGAKICQVFCAIGGGRGGGGNDAF